MREIGVKGNLVYLISTLPRHRPESCWVPMHSNVEAAYVAFLVSRYEEPEVFAAISELLP